MATISVIIPVYNTAPYLRECVDSVISQTFADTQIILVDDGSDDGSAGICDEYADRFDNVSVIHKSNGGLSEARNVGMAASHGEYTFFLDSDDRIVPDTLETLLGLLNGYDADIATAGHIYWYDNAAVPARGVDNDTVFDREDSMRELIGNSVIKNFAWGKLYRTELLDGLSFPPGRYYEDVYWTHLVFDRAGKTVLTHRGLVYYRQRADGISYGAVHKKLDLIDGYMLRRSFAAQRYPRLVPQVDEHIMKLTLEIYLQSLRRLERSGHAGITKELAGRARKLVKEGICRGGTMRRLKKSYALFSWCPAAYAVFAVICRAGGKMLEKYRKKGSLRAGAYAAREEKNYSVFQLLRR